MLPYSRQTIREDDIAAVVEALRQELITQGPRLERFEEALAAYCRSRFSVAVSSGTAALHLACLAAGAGPGAQVLTSPLTFVATANCALYCGAKPAFVDIDPATGNISPARLEEALCSEAKAGRRVAAVIPVHYAGYPCEMEEIAAAARRAGAAVIEDACHALGASWRDRKGVWHRVGDCFASDMTVFSFHPLKSITTAEGGAITTNDRACYERLRRLRTHGVVRASQMAKGSHPPWYYEVRELGFNYRISDLQCALGEAQLRKLPEFLAARSRLAQTYRRSLGGLDGIELMEWKDGRESAHHLFVIRIDPKTASRDRVAERLAEQEIGTQVHYLPVHLHPYYRGRFGYEPGDFPRAEEFYARALSLPLYPELSERDQSRIIGSLRAALAEASRPIGRHEVAGSIGGRRGVGQWTG